MKIRGSGKSVKEILAEAKKKPDTPQPPSSDLKALWVAEVYETTQAYVPPLTMKQMGQLNHFRKRCPEGKAAPVLTKVVREWGDFAYFVKDQAGAKSTPASPNIDFLLKHVGLAVGFLEGTPHQQPEAPVDTVKPFQMKSIATEDDPDDEEAPQSLEELLSIIGKKP